MPQEFLGGITHTTVTVTTTAATVLGATGLERRAVRFYAPKGNTNSVLLKWAALDKVFAELGPGQSYEAILGADIAAVFAVVAAGTETLQVSESA